MALFSVIVPYYNDPGRLYHCLESLHNQHFPMDKMEIIVIDDCSPVDITNEVTLRYPEVRFYRLPENRGPAAARNCGISMSHGQYIAFVDSDAMVGPHWLEALKREFELGETVVCGPVLHRNCLLGRITAITGFGNFLDTRNSYKPDCPSVNCAVVADEMKNFSYDESLASVKPNIMIQCEDTLLTRQFVAGGLRIRYAGDAWVLHDPRLNIRELNRRAFLYGLGFSVSRSINDSLPGYRLHRYLGGGSSIFLFAVRLVLDVTRMIKYHRTLKISTTNFLPTIIGIIWSRAIYSIGVFQGYRNSAFCSDMSRHKSSM